MKIYHRKNLALGMILLLMLAQSNCIDAPPKNPPVPQASPGPRTVATTTTVKTTDNDLNFSSLLDWLETLPYGVGLTMRDFLNFIARAVTTVDQVTNGAATRFIGGSLPCVIDIPTGMVCSGTSIKGGVYGLVEDSIKGLPRGIMPSIVKMLILNMIKMTINPTMDTLFGGLPKK